MKTMYKFSVKEADGTYDFGSYISFKEITDEQAIEAYRNSRYMSSIKGFKRPMPLEISLEEKFENII